MRRRATKTRGAAADKPPKFVAPRDPAQRATLREQLKAAWPDPKGTAVRHRKHGDCRTLSGSFFSSDGAIVVYVDAGPTAYNRVPVSSLRVVR